MFFEGAKFNIYEIPLLIFDIILVIYINYYLKRDD